MTEEDFRSKTIKIEQDKLEVERNKLTLENKFLRKNIGGLTSAFATILVVIIGFSGITTYQEAIAKATAERKLENYLSYLKTVNQAWAQYAISQSVDSALRQRGIDAYEELRVISSEEFVEKASKVNNHFAKLYLPFKISEKETSTFNSDFNDLKELARLEFAALQKE